jgi:hypothetical protein
VKFFLRHTMQNATLAARADSLSALQNLGVPLSRVNMPATQIPVPNPIPSLLDQSLQTRNTRTKKCCKAPLPIDRIASEWYPIDADHLKDLRPMDAVFGRPSRYDGRDPIGYVR